MAIIEIIAALDAEIARLEQVRKLLSSGRDIQIDKLLAKSSNGKKRTLSAAGRKRIADAQRRRWAAKKGKK